MRTRNVALLAVCLAFVGVTGVAQADYPSVNPSGSLLSAFHDTSNFWTSTTGYGFNLYNGPSDPALFINQINFLPSAGYDANIGLTTPVDTTYQTGFGSYTLGTALAPDTLMYLYDAVSRSGDVLPAVQNGIYDFNLQIVGGYDSAATDVLGNIPYQIQIADGIKVSASASASPGTSGLNASSRTVNGTSGSDRNTWPSGSAAANSQCRNRGNP